MLPSLDIHIVALPKGFKYSKNKRIRKKQRKNYTKVIYKGCSIQNYYESYGDYS